MAIAPSRKTASTTEVELAVTGEKKEPCERLLSPPGGQPTLESVAQTNLHAMLLAVVIRGSASVSHQAHGAAILVLQV